MGQIMFRQRLLTTLILVPLVILAIYHAPAWFLLACVILIISIGGFESLSLIPIHNKMLQAGFFILVYLCTWLGIEYYALWLMASVLIWTLIIMAVLTFPNSQTYWGFDGWVGFLCVFLLSLLGSSLIMLYRYPHGQDLLVYLLFLVWSADTGAYLAGKQFGRCKLIPHVSPGKTIEGVLGGFISATIVAYIGCLWFKPSLALHWFVLSTVIIGMSVIGDLFISILKRRVQVKDSGFILPGHGGILDRFDSLMAALPLFYFGLRFITLGN